ncbi:MAG: lipoyl(octanoyl) transferase LipB, partial [Fidelibacterota bacterium]
GQLVGYPILDLHHHRLSVSWFMRSLEEVIIRTLSRFDIQGYRRDGLTGVWVAGGKIAALGVRLSRWVSMHGFALNVNTDLTAFEGIIPCGIPPGRGGVTSMETVLNKTQDLTRVARILVEEFEEVFGKE